MGIGVSGWRLARAVSQLGQLGVVSGTALDLLLTRQLQLGDTGGHLRRALDAFPYPEVARRILGRYFIPGGKEDDAPFKTPPMISHQPSRSTRELVIASSFVAVHLAKEGHAGWVGLNLLEKIQTPTLLALYGAMLAGVNVVLMGAGIPRQIPKILDDLAAGNPAEMRLDVTGDPEIETRIAQYEMAYRMQASVPELTDLSDEKDEVFELYGPDSRRPGSYAANCILARRLIERGVRFVQLFHPDWDHHSRLTSWCTARCRDTDQPSAALVKDLKRRGLLEDTLVVWGGEFGRGVAGQGKWDSPEAGRDHHPRCFTMWMAGGGVKAGTVYGETDEFGYKSVKDVVHVHDLHATIMRLLGFNHEEFTFRSSGRDYRLTDVHGKIVQQIIA